MDGPFLILAAVVAIALFVRQMLGFGFSLTFVPLASFLLPPRDAVLVAIILEIIVSCLQCVELRRHLRMLEAMQLKVASLAGIWLGIVLLRLASPRPLFAACLLVAAPATLIVLFRPGMHLERSRVRLAFAGLMSGAMNVWGSFSGPPVVLYYLTTEKSPQEIKGLLTGYFLLVYLATAVSLTITGEYGHFSLWRSVLYGVAEILLLYPFFKSFAARLDAHFKPIAAGFLLLVSAIAFIRAAF
jgi:uncharacterized protein